MPQDASCPTCRHPFPVTEARSAFTVACPACDAEMTVEFKKPAAPPEAGQPHYDLLVKPGALAAAPAPPPARRKKDDEDDEPQRAGGSALVILLSGGLGLLFVLGGLGLTAWVLFEGIGRETASNTPASYPRPNNSPNNSNQFRPAPNQPNNPWPNQPNNPWPNNPPRPVEPPKPQDWFDLKPVAGTPQAITPPPYDLTTPRTIDLPGPAAGVSVGGNGRYVVLHIPSTRQLLCFDASKGQVFPAPEPAPDGDLLLAAGQNQLAVLARRNNVLSVYDLPTLRRRYDATGPPLSPHNTASLAMGSATNGPLLACNAFGEVVLMDVGPQGAVPVEGSKAKIGGDLTAPVRASANGRLFVRGGLGTDSKAVLVTEWGRKWKSIDSEVRGAYPSADGRYVFGYGAIGRDSGQTVGTRAPANVWYVPAVAGGHFLRLAETGPLGQATFSASVHSSYLSAERSTAASFALPEAAGLVGWGGRSAALDQQLFLIPDAKMLVTLTAKKDQLVMRKVDIK